MVKHTVYQTYTNKLSKVLEVLHGRIQKVMSEGVQLNFDGFFVCFVLVDEGREDPITTKSRPSSVHQ